MRRLLGFVGIAMLLSGAIWGWQRIATKSSQALPESPQERIDLYYQALGNRDTEQAKRIRQSFQSDPKSDDYQRFFGALDLLRARQLEKALAQFQYLVGNRQLRPYVLFSSAEILYRLENPADAESVLLQLIQDAPNHLDAHRLLGAIYYDLGAYLRAIPHLEFVLKESPDSVGTHYMLGIIFLERSDLPNSIEHFRKVFDIGIDEAFREEAISDYAEALIKSQKYEEAEELLASSDESAEHLSLRAKCLWNLQRREEAKDLVRQAENRDPRNRHYLLIVLQIQMDENRWEEAVQTAQDYLESRPHDADVRYTLAQALARQNLTSDYEREIAKYQKTHDLKLKWVKLNQDAMADTRDPVIREQLADVCEQLGKKDLAQMWRKAAEHCREANRVRSGNP